MAKKSSGIEQQTNRFPFGVATLPKSMAATSDDIVNLLRQRRIIASGQIVDSLRMHPDPAKLLDMGGKIDFHKGLLTQEIFSKLTELYPSSGQETNLTSTPKVSTTDAPSDLGRVIAPIAAPEPLDLEFRNNLPDWDENDYSCHAVDAPTDITVHYDITGKSTTEGKMNDITACFSDRLNKIRDMIVKNSKLPRRPTEVARLLREVHRYQGYENKAVAIGLVNEPRYTKNGHLMWSIEDETGEMNCLL